MTDQPTLTTEDSSGSNMLMPAGPSPVGIRRLSTLSNKTTDSGGARRPSMMMMRKSSFKNVAMSLVHGIRKNSRSMSIFGGQKQQPMKPKMENTYRLKPGDEEVFNCARVHSMVSDVLENFLGNIPYNAVECKELSQQISTLIRNRVKDLNYPRYKLVVNVLIGQNLQQEIQTASRCVWSPDTDSWVCVERNTDSLFALATVHAVYHE